MTGVPPQFCPSGAIEAARKRPIMLSNDRANAGTSARPLCNPSFV
jgi:hypothetical protein